MLTISKKYIKFYESVDNNLDKNWKLLKCEIHKCRLHNPYKNKNVMYRDCETMRDCIVKDLDL